MPRIEHFAIYAADAARLKDFYVDAFGMTVAVDNGAGSPPGYFLVDDGDGALEIIGRPEGERNAHQRYICHLAFWVDDFHAARAALEARGLVFEADTLADNDEIKTGFFNDPEGNRCQIVWRARTLRDRG